MPWIPIAEAARKARIDRTTVWRWTRRRRPDGTPLLASRHRELDPRYSRAVLVVDAAQMAAVLADPALRPRPPGRPPREEPPPACRTRGCGRVVDTRRGGGGGLCSRCYQRRRRKRRQSATTTK